MAVPGHGQLVYGSDPFRTAAQELPELTSRDQSAEAAVLEEKQQLMGAPRCRRRDEAAVVLREIEGRPRRSRRSVGLD
jgi:hypothetical protein